MEPRFGGTVYLHRHEIGVAMRATNHDKSRKAMRHLFELSEEYPHSGIIIMDTGVAQVTVEAVTALADEFDPLHPPRLMAIRLEAAGRYALRAAAAEMVNEYRMLQLHDRIFTQIHEYTARHNEV